MLTIEDRIARQETNLAAKRSRSAAQMARRNGETAKNMGCALYRF
jgi:hypothetical protein